MELPITEYGYVPVKNGYIHVNDIPVVKKESAISKIVKGAVVYAIITMGIIFIINYIYSLASITESFYKLDNLYPSYDVEYPVQAQYMDILVSGEVEKIILFTNDKPYAIDIKDNDTILKQKIKNKTIYFLDFVEPITVRRISIMSDAHNFVKEINVRLYDKYKYQVWDFTGILPDRRINDINTSKLKWKQKVIEFDKSEKKDDEEYLFMQTFIDSTRSLVL